MEMPNHEPIALTRMCQPSFTPEVDPSSLITVDALFEVLRSIQWSTGESSQEAEDDDSHEKPAHGASSGVSASSNPAT